MKALSVRPPWALLIAEGKKTIELRTRRVLFRGELLICESRGGGAVAIVELCDCREAAREDEEGACCDVRVGVEYAWVLRLIRRVTSPVIKGRLGFYEVSESLLTIV